MQGSFEKIKQAVADNTLLSYFDRQRRTYLIVDASPHSLGAVLAQQHDEHLRPVAFAHKALTETESRYAHMKKEALAVIWACDHFHLYLIGDEFTIVTDHKPLVVIYSPNSRSSARVERWGLRLQQYIFKIEYVEGANNMADPLSRLLRQNKPADSPIEQLTEAYINFIAHEALPKAITWKMIQHESSKDSEMEAIRLALSNNDWSNEAAQYRAVASELAVCEGVVLRGNRLVIPSSLRKRILNLANSVHQGITRTKALLRSKVWWPGVDEDITQLIANCLTCQSLQQTEKPELLRMSKWPDTVHGRIWQ